MTIENPWWKKYPERFLNEYRLISELANNTPEITNIGWKIVDGIIRVDGTVIGDSRNWEFVMVFTEMFPEAPPYVKPKRKDEHWSDHQYGRGGSLCLELGPDNWSSTVNHGSDMIESLIRLLLFQEEHPPGESDEVIESREELTLGQELRNKNLRLVDFQDIPATIADKPNYGTCVFGLTYAPGAVIYWPKEIPEGNTIDTLRSRGLISTNLTKKGAYFRIDTGIKDALLQKVLKYTELAEYTIDKFIGVEATALFKSADDDSVIVFIGTSGRLFPFRKVLKEDDVTLERISLVKSSIECRTPQRIFETLKNARIAIIGLGSVGSKVAMTLARSGVSKYVFVDDDILEESNIARHAATIEHAGAHKVDVMEDLITSVCGTEPEISKYKYNIGGQESTRDYSVCMKSLVSSDVIVDCTGSPMVFRILSIIASEYCIPFLWSEVFAGGFGGFVSFAMPDVTPCPQCIQNSMFDFLKDKPVAPGKNSKVPYADGVVVADDTSVSIVSDILSKRVQSSLKGLYDTPHHPCWLIGIEPEWIFDHPMEVIRIEARTDDYNCRYCWKSISGEAPLEEDDLKNYNDLIEELNKSEDE